VGHWTVKEDADNLVKERLNWWGLAGDPPAVKWVKGTARVHFIRYEHLQSDWAELPPWKEAGFVPELVKRNVNPGSYDWRRYYTEELADKVYHHQKADFDHFDYDRESWQP